MLFQRNINSDPSSSWTYTGLDRKTHSFKAKSVLIFPSLKQYTCIRQHSNSGKSNNKGYLC
jgi:hypothetical protein